MYKVFVPYTAPRIIYKLVVYKVFVPYTAPTQLSADMAISIADSVDHPSVLSEEPHAKNPTLSLSNAFIYCSYRVLVVLA